MEVRVIPARKTDENLQPKKLRVAAYCRVSSDLGSQDGSIESQKKPSDMFRKDWEIISAVEVADPAGRITENTHKGYCFFETVRHIMLIEVERLLFGRRDRY